MTDYTVHEEWVLSDDGTPFFTKEWAPRSGEVKAYVLFIHGFAEHIGRYDKFFPLLAAPPHSLHITAMDQRGHGKTAYEPLTGVSPEVQAWQKEGKKVHLITNGRRKTGGWGQVLPDMEFFVKRESERARAAGKQLLLWGHSMGGGQSLAFVTRPSAPPNTSTVSLLSGAIISAPLIRQTHPAPMIQLKAGGLAANVTPNLLIRTPLKYEHLSHNTEMNEANRLDQPMCEQFGSVRGVSDMLQGGMSLDTAETWGRWPRDLSLMMYHGSIDQICDPVATKRFFAGVDAPNKRLEMIEGMHHEVHNELEPTPSDVAGKVSEWISQIIGDGQAGTTGQAKL